VTLDGLLEFFDAPSSVSFKLTPLEALAFFNAKGLRTTFDWRDMLGEEHVAAFTVAKMMDQDLLADVHASLGAAMADGRSFQAWADELRPMLQAKGWWGREAVIDPLTGQTVVAQLGSAGRLKTIFRTNMQTAYSVGSWEQIASQKSVAPYLIYDAVDDWRTRESHAALDNKVLPVDDPFWSIWYPPNGYNCRCGVIQVDADELAQLGLTPDASPSIPTEKWTNPRTGKVEKVPVGQDPGFAYNAGKARLEHLMKIAAEKIAALAQAEMAAQAQQAAAAAGMKATQEAAQKTLEAEAVAAQKLLAKSEGQAQLARSQGKAAQRAAQFQIDKAVIEKTPYLSTAIAQIKKSGKTFGSPAELLEAAKAAASKAKQSNFLSEWKKAYIADKKPSANALAAFDALPTDAQLALKQVLDADKLSVQLEAKALAKLDEIKTGTGISQSQKDVLAKLEAAPGFAILPASQKLTKFEAAYAEFQAAKNAASALSNYKKAILAGKTPSAGQTAAFQALDPAAQAKFLAKIDAEKIKAAGGKPAPAPAQGYIAPATETAANADFLKGLDELKGLGAMGSQEAADLAANYAKYLEPGGLWAQMGLPGKKIVLKDLAKWIDKAEKDLVNLPAPAAPPPVAPAPKVTPGPLTPAPTAPNQTPLNVDKLTQIGGQGGSNPGGLFVDQDTGVQWYIKWPADETFIRNEALATKLYELAGVDVPEVRLITFNGKPAIASRIIDGLSSTTPAALAKTAGVLDNFAVDAWLANWDTVGLKFDNMLVKGGKAYRIDAGGSLLYRAQGGAKGAAFGDLVEEIDSLRNPKTNPQAAKVFGKIAPQQLEAGVAKVLAITDDQIRAVVNAYAPAAERQALIKRLIARRQDLAKRYPHLTAQQSVAKAEAVAFAQEEAKLALEAIDQEFLTAIKGIAARTAKGQPLENKDLLRVVNAKHALAKFPKDHAHLTDKTLLEVQTYYQAWVDALDAAIKPGEGKVGLWSGGKFSGFTGKIDADPARVKLPPPPPAGMKFTQPTAEKALRGVGAEVGYHKKARTGAWKQVPDRHQDAISHYTGAGYRSLNEHLRDGTATATMLRYSDLLDEALAIAPKFVGRSTRGIPLSGSDAKKFLKDHLEAWKNGGTVVHRGFISSTVGDTPAFSGNFWIHIDGKKGVHVNSISRHQGTENEVLLTHATEFKVTNMEEKNGRWHIWVTEP
jgi:SPP1 gp7 family putative phage head morphogenesis protein